MKKEKETEQKEKEKPINEEELERKMTSYAHIIIGLIVAMILGLFIYAAWNQADNNFVYHGMKFNKGIKNGVSMYYTSFVDKQLINGTFYINNRTFYFRNNPKYLELDKTLNKSIRIIPMNTIYISVEEPLPSCKNNFESIFDLSAFFNIYGLKVKGAVTNPERNTTELPLINCNSTLVHTVIIIGPGDYTGFEQLKDNCYKISYKDCEINKATEGFSLKILEQLADAMGLVKN